MDTVVEMSKAGQSSPRADAQNFCDIFSSYNTLIERAIQTPCSTIQMPCGGPPASEGLHYQLRRPTRLCVPQDVSLRFALLKDRLGVERAFLCGALALSEEALLALPGRVFIGAVILPCH